MSTKLNNIAELKGLSDFSMKMGLEADDKKWATASPKFETDPELLISRLSFSHIREIMKLDDPFERFFYEFA